MSFRTMVADARRREAALALSGLPECPWMKQSEHALLDATPTETKRIVDEINAHVGSCEICQSRERYLRQRFGEPSAAPTWMGPVARFFLFIDRHGRPTKALFGLAIGGVVLLICAGIALVPHAGLVEIPVYVAGIVGGAFMAWGSYQVVGLVHWAGFIGRWLARAISGTAGMLTFVWAFRLSGYASALSKAGDVSPAREDAQLAVILGIVYGTFVPIVMFFQKRRGDK